MSAAALGAIARPEPGLPSVALRPISDRIALALLPAAAGHDPHARLSACLDVHAICPSFLPLPPARFVAAGLAERAVMGAEEAVYAAIARCAGEVDMIVDVQSDLKDAGGPAESSGREWLHRRQAHRAMDALIRDWLTDLTERAGGRVSRFEAAPTAACAHLRIPRAALPDLERTIRAHRASLLAPVGQIVVSGPWPPFSLAAETLQNVPAS